MIILLNLSQIILKIINPFLESLLFAQEISPFTYLIGFFQLRHQVTLDLKA